MKSTGPFVPDRLAIWAKWIVEREKIRQRRMAGKPPPWHDDPIMAGTRWCNVRRMDDKVSKWLIESWYSPGDMCRRDALIAALMGRMINKPETLWYIAGNSRFKKWDYDKFYKGMYELKNSGQTVFTSAYIINGASGGPKIDQVLGAIDRAAKAMKTDSIAKRYIEPDSLQETAKRLHDLPGVGSFISGQVVADLRWVLPECGWEDKMTWAPPGPGSSRGMKYLLGEPTECVFGRGSDMNEKQFLKYLRLLIEIAQEHPKVGPIFKDRKLEAHDIQNTLCETSKYARCLNGGRGKNKYVPPLEEDESWW